MIYFWMDVSQVVLPPVHPRPFLLLLSSCTLGAMIFLYLLENSLNVLIRAYRDQSDGCPAGVNCYFVENERFGIYSAAHGGGSRHCFPKNTFYRPERRVYVT